MPVRLPSTLPVTLPVRLPSKVVAVTTPVTSIPLLLIVVTPAFTSDWNVATPATCRSSTSRCPSISTLPFKSKVPANVAIPLMFTSSNSV